MNPVHPAAEPPLDDTCRAALEAWVCEDPASAEAEDHLRTCANCRELAEAIELDQQLLRWQLGRLDTPAPPRLVLRDPLRAASGHPRRVSLAVVPFLLGLVLVLMLGVIAMLGEIGQRRDVVRLTVLELGRLQEIVDRHGSAIAAEGTDWAAQIEAAEPGALAEVLGAPPRIGEAGALDRYEAPYRVRKADGAWIVYSTGPNRVDERGAGDDLDPKDR